MKNPHKISSAILFLFSSLILTACAAVDKGMMSLSDGISSPDPVTGKRQINLTSESEEIRKATEFTTQILNAASSAGLKVDDQFPQFSTVKLVFERLKEVVHRKQLPWDIHVIEHEEFNAFTAGGGKLFLFSGIFQSDIGVQTDDELAAIIAHEMTHVAARHVSENGSKLALMQLADKGLRNEMFKASFTTVQEDEADKYSVIYMALAGYDPTAGIQIWNRLHTAFGSYTGNLLYDHPLSDDRARNIAEYASKARQYYIPNNINHDYETILKKNALFSYQVDTSLEPGKGGGLITLVDTVVNVFSEIMEARTEQYKRQVKQIEQERDAQRKLQFYNLKIDSSWWSGKQFLTGVAMNFTNKIIVEAFVNIEYLDQQKNVIYKEELSWGKMSPYEKKEFKIELKPIIYSYVTIRSKYVRIEGE